MKKFLNYALLVTFVLTVLAPITGVQLHKIASSLFLLLSLVHTLVYRKALRVRRAFLLALVLLCYITGVLCLIFSESAVLLALHKVLSIGNVFFLAIHIFVFHRKLHFA